MSLKFVKCELEGCRESVYVRWFNSLGEELFFCKKCFKLLDKIYEYEIISKEPILTVKTVEDNRMTGSD